MFFISVQGNAEREYFKRGRGRFPFFLLNWERVPRERVVLRVCFHLGRERLGCREPSFPLNIYVSLFANLRDFVNERCV